MKQLALPIRRADHAVFDNFLAAGNEAAVHTLEQVAAQAGRKAVWLWGGAGTGKSHLLQACVAAADLAGRRAVYLPLGGNEPLPPDVLEGLGQLDLIGVDNLHAVAGDPRWEEALFRLYEELRAVDGGLVVAATAPPGDTGIQLADLRSRLASGPVFRLQSLDDETRLQALQLRARFRGFELPDDTGRYLLRRRERDSVALFRMLDELDRAALAAQKRLTIPFVKDVFGP